MKAFGILVGAMLLGGVLAVGGAVGALYYAGVIDSRGCPALPNCKAPHCVKGCKCKACHQGQRHLGDTVGDTLENSSGAN